MPQHHIRSSRRYLRCRTRQVQVRPGDAAALRHLLDFVRGEGVIAAEKLPACRLNWVAQRAISSGTPVRYQ